MFLSQYNLLDVCPCKFCRCNESTLYCDCDYESGRRIVSCIIPECVTEIETELFYSYASLRRLDIRAKVTVIPDSICIYCECLEHVTLPDTVEYIHNSAFARTAITKINLPNTLKHISESAFERTDLLNVYIPDGCTLGDYVFSNCTSMKRARLPGDIRCIPHSTFFNCISLRHLIIPDTVQEIQSFALQCTGLKTLTIPPSVKYIGKNAVLDSQITTLNIHSPNVRIDASAFGYCRSLRTLTLPSTPLSISPTAFDKCVDIYDTLEEEGYEKPLAAKGWLL